MKRKHKIVLGVALLVLCISIGLGIALWYLFGGNPNDSGDNGDDTTTVTPGDPDENPETPHEHTYTSAVTREPTCTQEGEMTYTCTCGDSYTEPIAMTAHTEVIDEAVAPSCTKTGLTEGKHCSVCGTVLVEQEVVPMTAHTEVIDAAVAPTCTQTGLTEGKHCSVCGAVLVEQEVVPMIPHTEVIDAAVKPTCTQTGLTEGKHCSVCDTVLVEQEVVPMTAHNYVGEVTKKPTCKQEGEMTYTCSGCGGSYTESIPMTAHTEVIDAAVAPTCTATGLTEGKHCSVCGEILVEQQVIAMIAHNYSVDWDYNEDEHWHACISCGARADIAAHIPDRDQPSENVPVKCTVCEYIIEPATGHIVHTAGDKWFSDGINHWQTCIGCGIKMNEAAHSGGVATCISKAQCTVCNVQYGELAAHSPEVIPAVAPTCTKTGLTEGQKCSVCGTVLVEQEVVPTIAHNYVGEETKKPTCEQEGEMTYTCSACGDSYTESIPMTAHTEVIDEAITPTCIKTGLTEGKHCSVCGTVLVEQEVVPTIAHNYVGEETKKPTCEQEGEMTYTCSVCGDSYTESIPMTAHTEVIDEAVEPTCTATGLTEGKHCSVCGEILVAQQVIPANGHSYASSVTKKPTCEQEGEMTYTCSACGDSYTESIPMTAHTEVIDEAITPTCIKTGLTEGKHCSVCGEVLVEQEVVPTIAHNYVGEETKKPTCEQEGEMTYTCSGCGGSYTESIPMTAHTEVIDKAVAPSCTKTGLTEGKHCSVCSTVLVEQEVVPMIPHTEVIDAGVKPTCTQTGLTEGKHCSVCDTVLVKQEVIPMTAHTEVIDKAVAPTCTKTGLTEGKHCSVCGEILVKQQVIPANGHTVVIDKAVEPTCTKTGLTEGKHCSICGTVFIEQEVIPMTEHIEVIDVAVTPSCTSTGLTEGKHCSVCGKVLIKQEVVPMTEHCYTSEVTQEPSCTQTGEMTYTCSVCGDSYTESISMIAHNYSNGICVECGQEESTTGLVFTLSSDGSYYSVTDYVGTDKEVYVPNTHNGLSVKAISSSAFKNCSKITFVSIPTSVTSIGGSAFSGCSSLGSMKLPFVGGSIKSSTDTYQYPFGYIFGTSSYTGGMAVQQSYYGNSISSTTYATYYIPSSLKEVTITGGNILHGAFYACRGLTSITIPNSVTSIERKAFYGCRSLTSITIPNSVTSIWDVAFYDCSSLTSVTIGNSVTSIWIQAFGGCSSLRNITIPNSVTSIWIQAFGGCSSLTSITIPDSVTSIGAGAFGGCSLTSITVASGNPVYHSAGNCIIETESKTLIVGCKNSVIPTDGSVTSIGYSAFSGCSGLTSITIPNSVTSIGGEAFSNTGYYNNSSNWENGVLYLGKWAIDCDDTSVTAVSLRSDTVGIADSAFSSCRSLTSITIPNSVTNIGKSAFSWSSNLTSVAFEDPNGWWRSTSSTATSGTSFLSSSLSNPSTAAMYLRSSYRDYYWRKG